MPQVQQNKSSHKQAAVHCNGQEVLHWWSIVLDVWKRTELNRKTLGSNS